MADDQNTNASWHATLIGRLLALRVRGIRDTWEWTAEIVGVLSALNLPAAVIDALPKIPETGSSGSILQPDQTVSDAQVIKVIDTAILLSTSRPRALQAEFAEVYGSDFAREMRREAHKNMRELISAELRGSLDEAIVNSSWIRMARLVLPGILGLALALSIGGSFLGAYQISSLSQQSEAAKRAIEQLRDTAQDQIQDQINAEVKTRTQALDALFDTAEATANKTIADDTTNLGSYLEKEQTAFESQETQSLNGNEVSLNENLAVAEKNGAQQILDSANILMEDLKAQKTQADSDYANYTANKSTSQANLAAAENDGVQQINASAKIVIEHLNAQTAQADSDYQAYKANLASLTDGYPAQVDQLKADVAGLQKTQDSWGDVQKTQEKILDLWQRFMAFQTNSNTAGKLISIVKLQNRIFNLFEALSIASALLSLAAIFLAWWKRPVK
jgi:hypothetical protein